jgi:DNA-binding IclR family transcriptional regulator
MNNEEINSEVKQFILTKISSVPHLEALLLIWGHGSKVWTLKELADALFVPAANAKTIINDLMRHGWIVQHSARPKSFTYDSSWDSEGEFMKLLADTYRTKLVRVATLIHTNASSAVRDFANAFDFKKE